MEKFKKFKIQNSKFIFGGRVTKTIFSTPTGGGGVDMYDHDSGELYNLLGQQIN